jgi:hypothetical protein
MKRRTLTQIFIAAFVLCVVSASIHPFGAVKHDRNNRVLLSGASLDSETAAIFARSCQSCHSQRTVWPWYSYVPPVLWLVERDVGKARAQMNLSRWEGYTNEERQAYLGEIAAVVRNTQMPPSRFTALHPDARLSAAERERIYTWARRERRRLRPPL